MARVLLWSMAVVLLLVVGLAALREPLGRALFPDTALAGVIARAEAALAAGDLEAAARHWQAAEARDPDHPRVELGRARWREAVLGELGAALAQSEIAKATALLAWAEVGGVPEGSLAPLRAQLAALREPPIEQLLRQAAFDEDSHPERALAAYRQVLAREPRNPLALAGQRRMLGHGLERLALRLVAAPALAADEIAAIHALLAEVRELDPAHPGLREVETRLGERLAAMAVGPSGPDSPDPADAAQASRWLGLAEEALGRGEWSRAAEALDRARALAPQAAGLVELEQRLRQAGVEDGEGGGSPQRGP